MPARSAATEPIIPAIPICTGKSAETIKPMIPTAINAMIIPFNINGPHFMQDTDAMRLAVYYACSFFRVHTANQCELWRSFWHYSATIKEERHEPDWQTLQVTGQTFQFSERRRLIFIFGGQARRQRASALHTTTVYACVRILSEASPRSRCTCTATTTQAERKRPSRIRCTRCCMTCRTRKSPPSPSGKPS